MMLFGSIAVSGAPTDEQDEWCAAQGLKNVIDELELEG